MLCFRFKSPNCHRFLLLLYLSLPLALSSSQPCYNHDGSVVVNDTSCQPELKQSFCCGSGWACLDNGICSNHNTTSITDMVAGQQRATCTDRSFPSDRCPQYCQGNTGSGREVRTFHNGTFCCVFSGDICIADPAISSLKEGVPFTTIDVPPGSSILSTSDASSSYHTATSLVISLSPSSSYHTATSIISLSLSDASSFSHTTTSSIISHSPAPSTTLTSPAISTPLSQTAASAATPTDSATTIPASTSLPQSTKLALDIALPICVIAVIITPLSFWFKRRRTRKAAAAAAEVKTASAREQEPASDVSPLDYASLGHAPRELEGARRHEWETRGELPLNEQKAQVELMGSIAAQELGG